MKKISCHTNLDLSQEFWPTELPEIPRIGDRIQSTTVRNKCNFRLCLEVVSVTWRYSSEGYYPEIELHDHMKRSIREFYEWYAPMVGKNVNSFI